MTRHAVATIRVIPWIEQDGERWERPVDRMGQLLVEVNDGCESNHTIDPLS
jgi:hypothetical protein